MKHRGNGDSLWKEGVSRQRIRKEAFQMEGMSCTKLRRRRWNDTFKNSNNFAGEES